MILNKLVRKDNHPVLGLWPGELHRLVEDFWGDRLGTELSQAHWVPAVDIEETAEAYILKAEMPGLKKEDVKISLSDNILTLLGEKRSEERSESKRYHRVERSYGTFQRSFELSAPIQADKVSASYKEGVLTVTVPKSEEAKPREIDIKVD